MYKLKLGLPVHLQKPLDLRVSYVKFKCHSYFNYPRKDVSLFKKK